MAERLSNEARLVREIVVRDMVDVDKSGGLKSKPSRIRVNIQDYETGVKVYALSSVSGAKCIYTFPDLTNPYRMSRIAG
jgi:hypothetical protein